MEQTGDPGVDRGQWADLTNGESDPSGTWVLPYPSAFTVATELARRTIMEPTCSV